jgi:hypothetical protein
MKKAVLFFSGVLFGVGIIWALAAYEHGWAHFLGIDTQASQNYDFVSGVGPMIITALGFSGMILGLWHNLNCHAPGCLRIGRHKVSGTPWCNIHQEEARPERSERELLERVVELLERQWD